MKTILHYLNPSSLITQCCRPSIAPDADLPFLGQDATFKLDQLTVCQIFGSAFGTRLGDKLIKLGCKNFTHLDNRYSVRFNSDADIQKLRSTLINSDFYVPYITPKDDYFILSDGHPLLNKTFGSAAGKNILQQLNSQGVSDFSEEGSSLFFSSDPGLTFNIHMTDSYGQIFSIKETDVSGKYEICRSFMSHDERVQDVARCIKEPASQTQAITYNYYPPSVYIKEVSNENTSVVSMNNSSAGILKTGHCLMTFGLCGCTAIGIQTKTKEGLGPCFLAHYDNPYKIKENVMNFIEKHQGETVAATITNNGEPPQALIDTLEAKGIAVTYIRGNHTKFGMINNNDEKMTVFVES